MEKGPALLSKRLTLPDSWEEVNDLFYGNGWTDGLPIVPPTEERVFKMLAYTDRAPDEVIAEVPPKGGTATVEKMAINAVMAGCLPQYLPVLIAVVQALVEPQFNLLGIQATTHPVSPLLIVNGPIARELEINSRHGALGPGRRANATIGRAVRLILLNIGGARPGIEDKSTLGQPGKYTYCLAENEEESPWEPLHVERGYAYDTSTVTVVGGEAPHNCNNPISPTGLGILTIAAGMGETGMNNNWHDGEPLFIFCPEHAAIIARDGYSKADVKAFLHERARLPLYRFGQDYVRRRFIEKFPDRYKDATMDTLIPMAARPEDILVVVAGGAGRHSMFIPTFGETHSVTKPIAFKDGRPAKSIEELRADRT